jgi:hypothetical protein
MREVPRTGCFPFSSGESPLSESSIGVSRETLQRLKEAKPALAAYWAKSGKLLRSDDDAINALLDIAHP